MNKSILVPIDFTEITENALKHALGLSKTLNTGVKLLNLVKKETEANRAKSLLETLAEKYADQNIPISTFAEIGEIKEIGHFAEKLQSGLVVMGTHGLKGIQYLVGSKALTVITNASTPFIVTQAAPTKTVVKEIVVPMDFVSEEKVILSAISKFANALQAKVRVLAAGHDDEILSKKVKLNLSFAKRYLREKNVDFTINEAPGKKSFQDEIMDFTKMVDADMIALVNHHEDGYKNLLGKNFDQNIITNSHKIPVFMFTGKKISDHRDIFMMFS
ncbi:MAG: universal stress protein [Cryomorphaceae bacterium]|nr:universal stress protein [Cryomorphaceae bacterium]